MKNAEITYICSALIYGTIGIIYHFVNLESDVFALSRAILGSVFILIFFSLKGRKLDLKLIKKNIGRLIPSGFFLGINWIFLFQSYNSAGVAVGSLLNYIAPIIVVVITAIFKKEKLSLVKVLCIIGVCLGVVFISGVLEINTTVNGEGIVLGLLAAVAFVFLIIANRRLVDVPSYEKTFMQLFIGAITITPYCIYNNVGKSIHLDTLSIVMLLVAVILCTDIANFLYLGSIGKIKVEAVAILGYLEPATATILSVIVLHESLSVLGIIGAILIISCAAISEVAK